MEAKFKISEGFDSEIYIGELQKTVILIAGTAGSGKGTASTVIEEYLRNDGHTVDEINMADVMREIARILGWDGNKTPVFRKFMQQFGTDVVRNIVGEDAWINIWFKVARRSDAEYILVNDVRFENEIAIIQEYAEDNMSLKLRGKDDGYTDYEHESEAGIPDHYFQSLISNTYDDKFKKLITVEAALLTLKPELYDA